MAGGVRPAAPLALEPARTFGPKLFLRDRDDEWGRLFLALALLFNDLKFCATALVWLDERMPSPAAFASYTAEAGEFRGFALTGHRYMAGILYELMVLIREHKMLVESPTLGRLASGMPELCREAWDDVVAVAVGRDDDTKELRRILMRIRNDLAFHYYNPKILARGYEAHFGRAAEGRPYDRAYWSPGVNMERTRFHLADAAAEGAVAEVAGMRIPEWEKVAGPLAHQVNLALRYLVEQFIKERTGSGGAIP